ncbi:MAG: S-layer homology domain-containing protein [Clostridia bacterium]|nr:S-layer homology domain-containing protein [Clostridia bacterium]
MKNFNRILALVLAVMMVVGGMISTAAADATAVEYNETAITRLNKLGIFKGSTSGDMHADDNVTREQMALFTGRVLTGKVETNYWESYINDTTFTDIDNEAAEYVGAIAYAYEQGVVIGKSDIRFDPKGNVSYQDALTMVVRSLGYTGLSYPNGYINKAMKLGLTAGISGVAYKDAAVRGVIATILYNALYAEDSLFAKNFDLTSGNYMLVATPSVVINSTLTLPGASIGGYVGKKLNEGYVAFAAIGDDFRPVNNNYVYAKTSQISDDIDGNFADYLGYAYELTFENDVLTWGDQCATKTFVNYGDDREIGIEYIDYDHNYNGNAIEYADDWFLTFGGQAYNLVDKYDADYTAPTGTHNIILYNDFGSVSKINHYDYLFNANGDLVDANGATVLENRNGTYYITVGGVSRKATSDEIEAAFAELVESDALGFNYNSDYNMIEQGDNIAAYPAFGLVDGKELIVDEWVRDAVMTIARNYFCEITAMDYNNDGIYDAAIYTPYYLGQTGDSSGTTFTLTGVTNADGTANLLTSKKHADYVVTGATKKVGSYSMYVYKFNRHTNTITIKEIATTAPGKIEWAAKGKISANGIYENSQVKIGEKVLKVGGWNIDNLLGLYAIRYKYRDNGYWSKVNALYNGTLPTYVDYSTGTTMTGFNDWYYNGWNDILEFGMTSKFSSFSGYVVAGHLISGCPVPATADTYGFVAFNPYQSTFALVNGQIVVNALVDATGTYREVKINSVDGETFGSLDREIFREYIDLFYGANASEREYGYYYDADRVATIKGTALYKAVERANIIEALASTVDANNDWAADGSGIATTNFYGVIGKKDDGSYMLSVVNPGTVSNTAVTDTITFKFNNSSAPIVSGGKVIEVNADTVFTFVAKDGIYRYVGVPAAGYSIVLNGGKTVYVANSSQIMIVDQTRDISEIAVGNVDWTEKVKDIELPCGTLYRNHLDTWAFVEYVPYVNSTFAYDEVYMVTEKTANDKIYVEEDGTLIYVYSNLYNVIENKYEETVIFTGEEVEVFKTATGVWYESGTDKVALNLGAFIVRDADLGVNGFAYDAEENVFAFADVFGNSTGLLTDTYKSVVKNNNNAIVTVKMAGDDYAVTSVTVITYYKGTATITVGDFSAIKTDAVAYFTYDVVTGALVGYAFK